MKLNPRLDLVFKKLFGCEENKDILKAFINAVVSKDQQMETIEIQNPFDLASYKEVYEFLLEIKARDQLGRRYNILVQLATQPRYAKRALYYSAKGYSDQAGSNLVFNEVNKTIGINILLFDYLDEPEYHNIYRLLNEKSKNELSNILEIHFIELSKFDTADQELKSALDRWVAFMNEAHKYSKAEIPEKFKDDQAVTKAIEKLDEMSITEEEREIYEAQLKAFRDRIEQINTAREEGLAEGLAEGLTEGEAKGKKEKSLEIAKNLLDLLDVETIAQRTGLSIEEIAALKK